MTPPIPVPPTLADRLSALLGERYVVEHEVGSGGMAIVFAAQDLRHGRTVAVKVLRPELAATIGAERFLREVQLVAALQHPHILPVYDSGAGDGIFFFVMPFVDGEALSARIARDGPLPLAESVALARAVAGALAFAHARGIVHRDIKPENILLSNGHALVSDFGIARAIDASAGRLTATGMAVGTPMYMSPEQALGSSEVDARSDVYSLGCVLYEMLTARQPFAGASLQSIVAQSITAPRPRAGKVRRDVPAALDDVIGKALATEPAERYQSAAELDAALATVHSDGRASPAKGLSWIAGVAAVAAAFAAAVTIGVRSRAPSTSSAVAKNARVIAVLPFTTTGSDANGLSEGLVDLISTNLDGVGGIRTIAPRTALGRWRARAGAAGTLDDRASLALGRELDAGAVVTGTVVALGSTMRLNAALTGVDGTPLAKAQADGPADAMLSIVDTLSVRLLRDVWRSTAPVPGLHVSALTTGSLSAMRAYLEGERLFRRSDWSGAERAYNRAIEQDSSFALAYLRLLTTEEWLGASQADLHALGELLRRRVDRLPARDRSLAIGSLLYHEGRLAAADTAVALTSRYPDALDAWMLLGETRYHGQSLLAPTGEELRAPFERVLAIDSSLTTAYVHLLDLGAMFGDSANFGRDLARLHAVAGSADTTVALYQLVGDALWGASAARTAALRTIASSRTSVAGFVVRGAVATPNAIEATLSELSRVAGTPPGDSVQYHRIALLLATGRLHEARDVWRALIARRPDLQVAYSFGWDPLSMGIADGADSLDALAALQLTSKHWSPRSAGLLADAEYGIATRDTSLVRRSLAAALAIDTTRLPIRFHSMIEAVSGWEGVARGDSSGGARAIGNVIASSDFTLGHLMVRPRWIRAVVLSRNAATRAEGIRLLRNGFLTDPEFAGVRELALREALLANGDVAAADSAAKRFALIWSHADPGARAAAARTFPRGAAP